MSAKKGVIISQEVIKEYAKGSALSKKMRLEKTVEAVNVHLIVELKRKIAQVMLKING